MTDEQLLKLAEMVGRHDQILTDFDIENIPRRQRKNLPYVLDWWGDRVVKAKDWRFYVPLILGFIGPIIGGIIVVLVTK